MQRLHQRRISHCFGTDVPSTVLHVLPLQVTRLLNIHLQMYNVVWGEPPIMYNYILKFSVQYATVPIIVELSEKYSAR